MNYRTTTTDQQLLADEVKVWIFVMFENILKERTLRGLQYNTPEEKTEEGTCEFLSKWIAVFHTNVARVMRTKGNLFKEKELKNSLPDIERNFLNLTQKIKHVNLTVLDKLEIFRELMEKIENCYKLLPSLHTNIHASVLRDFFFNFNQTKETAEVQKISEIELD